jgi:decaprenylphospho-beta-D-ribofuranose 2-oxidase
VIACLNALGQGRRWLLTLVWGAIVGFAAEVAIVHAKVPRYCYNAHFFAWRIAQVPVCIGIGWGLVFYAASWTAQRLQFKSPAASAFIAGILGVNLDLSLDPVTTQLHFWVWRPAETAQKFAGGASLFGVPFDNFVAWVVMIAAYGGCVRWAFGRVNAVYYEKDPGNRPPGGVALIKKKRSPLWLDVLVPLGGAVLAGVGFILIRGQADNIYRAVGWIYGQAGPDLGEAIVFGVIFLIGLGVFWHHVFKGVRDKEINWVVLGIVVYFHALSLLLFVAGGMRRDAALMVVIPMNLVAGFMAFAWPSIDALVERSAPRQQRLRMPPLIFKTLNSYSGDLTRPLVATPRDRDELKAVLAYARSSGRQVTFRAGGQAFDRQSLNDQVVISLARFTEIKVDATTATATVGSGATWFQILKATLPHGLVPHVMVTSRAATAGGTLSSHSVSRFTPTTGREGEHVDSLVLVTPDGQQWTCSSSVNSDLFHAAVGGLGYVGGIVEITYRLRRLDLPNARVHTRFEVVDGAANIGQAIRNPRSFAHLVPRVVAAACQHPAEEGGGVALSAAVNMRGRARALIARSQYVPAATKLDRSIFHNPKSPLHLLLQLCATIPFLRDLGYLVTFRAYRKTREFVDDVFGYTFFEDGNRWVRGFLQLLGCPARILQQTFMIPFDEQGARLEEFLTRSAAHLSWMNIDPALIDILYVPADGRPFALSSTRQFSAFAVTFTFERLFRALRRERVALKRMSRLCSRTGGHLHLVKNVVARPVDTSAWYAPQIQQLGQLRRQRDAEVLRNQFAAEHLPGL